MTYFFLFIHPEKINHELSKQTGYDIYFEHVATKTQAVFPGFVKTIKDSYQVGWTPVNVYGRMDPIITYQRTSRTCTLTFDVLSDSVDRSRENQRAIKTLTRMLYPKVLSGYFFSPFP